MPGSGAQESALFLLWDVAAAAHPFLQIRHPKVPGRKPEKTLEWKSLWGKWMRMRVVENL